MTTGEDTAPEERPGGGRPVLLLAGGALLMLGGVFALLEIDFVVGSSGLIFGATLLVIGVIARTWDRHPTYEEREEARARRRKEKWDRGSAARERDRIRWEAHQARRARRSDG